MSPSVVASLESATPPQILADGGRASDSIYQPAPNVHIALGRPTAEQVQLAATGAGGAPSSTTNMSYHGGPTQQTVAAYTIFWSPHGTISSSYRTLINRYFQDIGGSSFYNIVSQYPGLTDTQNVSTLGGTWIDTTPYPAGGGTASNPLSHTDITTEVTRALGMNPSWNPAGIGRTYFVYTEPGIENCWDPTVAYANLSCSPGVASPNGVLCAYHSVFGTLNNPVIYANMPYGETWPGVCRGFGTSPNGDMAADGEISISSHEQFEVVTDPFVGAPAPYSAWYDTDSSGEIGDKCAYKYGSIMPDGHNLTLNGHPYIAQLEWSNANNDGVTPFKGCVDSYGAFSTTPSPTPSPTPTPTPSHSPTPTPTSGVWSASNFHWYELLPSGYCDLTKPIPPGNPYPVGLCAHFELHIPDSTYTLRTFWARDGTTLYDTWAPTSHLYPGTWDFWINGLLQPGTYSLTLYANGVFLGTAQVVITSIPTLGNANCDNKIDGMDVLTVLTNSSACPHNADVDGDGHVTPFDALFILKYWAGLISKFPADG